MTDWDVDVGSELSREDRVERFGGSPYGGIEPSRKTPNVFVYSDRTRAGAYGYDFDGWVGEELLHTGEGRAGDQELREGNRALLDHADAGRAVRVFIADGYVESTNTRRNIYIGEFEINREHPYFIAEAPDINRDLRTVIVFRLRPVGEHLRRPQDESSSGLPPLTGDSEDAEPGPASYETEVESTNGVSFERKQIDSTTAIRREAQLVARYKAHLERQGHIVKGRRIRPAGEYQWLRADLIDITARELYEAKGVTTRDSIRLAIGQLYDYSRFVPVDGLAVLVPTRPSDDLVALLLSRNISCVYEAVPGSFRRVDPSE
jgi:5-methylcytosine-specific restriction protein A